MTYQRQVWSLLLDDACRRVVAHLEQAGQQFIVLKGATIANWLYSESTTRTYADLDILVPREDEPAVIALLGQLGYRPVLDAAALRVISPEEQPLVDGRGVTIDLHVAIKGIRLPPMPAWQVLHEHVAPWPWADFTVPALDLTARTMHLALLLVARGDLAVSAAGAALVAVRLLGSRVSGASRNLSDILEAAIFLQDLQDFRSRAPRQGNSPDSLLPAAPDRFDEVVVKDVSFTYPGAVQPALNGASIRLRRGEVVALVGENGSGKTTLAKLLANLFDPDKGAILWDGDDLRQYDAASVRRRIAVLFQDFIRYRFTAHANIALGRADEDLDEGTVRGAALRAGADRFLSALPAGYKTVLSKEYADGTDLSLGQWQRVALARAFVRDAPLLILDEPSASLDPRTEHNLFERIRTLFADRTVLVISHRFSTVRSADRIYVLAEGRVIEEGDHAGLMEQRGVYADLFHLQASRYVNGDPGTAPDPSG